MKRNEKAICENCPYWKRYDYDYSKGDCRRKNPTEYNGQGYAIFPITLCVDWCGEHPDFEQKPEGKMYWATPADIIGTDGPFNVYRAREGEPPEDVDPKTVVWSSGQKNKGDKT